MAKGKWQMGEATPWQMANGKWDIFHLPCRALSISHLLFAICLLPCPSLYAATTGAAFLKLGAGARPLALGDAYTAVGGDDDSLYTNPAGLAALPHPELSVTHSDWFQDTTYDLVSYAHPTGYGTLGISALRLGGGSQQGFDALRQPTGSFSSDNMAALLSYSNSLGGKAALGTNLKYIRSRIANDSASTVAFDFGAQARCPGLPLWLGASVLNLGSGLRYIDQTDRLPLVIAIGAAAVPIRPLMLTLDVKHEPYDQLTQVAAGAEYTLSVFALRLGYTLPVEGAGSDHLRTTTDLRGGIGLQISRYRADVTLAPFGDLGLTERITLSVRFGAGGNETGPHNLEYPQAQISPEMTEFLVDRQ